MSQQERQQAKDMDSLQSEELDPYLAVPGWRMWSLNIFSKPETLEGFKAVETKPFALRVSVGQKAWAYIDHRYMQAAYPGRPRLPFRGVGTTDMPVYLLEPLTEDEIRIIDEQGEASGRPMGSTGKPHELIRPEELKRILGH